MHIAFQHGNRQPWRRKNELYAGQKSKTGLRPRLPDSNLQVAFSDFQTSSFLISNIFLSSFPGFSFPHFLFSKAKSCMLFLDLAYIFFQIRKSNLEIGNLEIRNLEMRKLEMIKSNDRFLGNLETRKKIRTPRHETKSPFQHLCIYNFKFLVSIFITC